MNATIEHLIDDTLYGRRIGGKDRSCLVTNEAGSELVRYSGNILTELERTILEINDSGRCQSGSIAGFAGLEYVLGAYLVNAARYDVKRAVKFIESLRSAFVREFLANMPVFFRRMEASYNFELAPPEEYKQMALKLIDSTNEDLAATAKRVVEKLTR